MKILVLNGSPKGKESVTMQSVKIMEMFSKNNDFVYYDVIKYVDKLDTELERENLKKLINSSSAIIWAFPVYHLLVPGHLKKFIENIFDSSLRECFKGKYSLVFTTSINYYDVTAHKYMEEIISDLDSYLIDSLSHNMEAIFKESGRKEIENFIGNLEYAIENKMKFSNLSREVRSVAVYEGKNIGEKLQMNGKVCLVGDIDESLSLINMVKEYTSYFDNVDVFDISKEKSINYCLGCMKCARTQKCINEKRDGIRNIIDKIISEYDIIIFAGEIKDRYLTWRMKTLFDRTFVYNHIPIFKGKQLGFIISGELSKNQNLRNILEVYSQGGRNLIGIVTDESEDKDTISNDIRTLSHLSRKYYENSYFRSENFYGVSGHKIFRDAVYSDLGTIFKYDYRYYKENGHFDYLSTLDKVKYSFRRMFFKRKKVEEYMMNNMTSLMVSGHKKVVEEVLKNV